MSKRLDYNQIAPAGLKALGGGHGYVAQSSLPAQLSQIVQRVRGGRLQTNIGNDDAVAAFNRTERRKGKTINPRSSVSDTHPSMHAAGRRCPDRPATSHGRWHEMSNGLSNAATFPPERQMIEEKIIMKAIVVTDQAAGTAGMKLAEPRKCVALDISR